ncbi:MAG: hypothetical protein AYK18_12845 [Theionarchaea archaeon DG-70]|nr:MAG: hypothetical protein AYK18_12845 [Theionarchaea archaeon DG-70]
MKTKELWFSFSLPDRFVSRMYLLCWAAPRVKGFFFSEDNRGLPQTQGIPGGKIVSKAIESLY